MEFLDAIAPPATHALLIGVFLLIVLQEAVNGFHDTANAVATVIYSRAMKPYPAVMLAAVCNFVGVLIGGTAVAFSMVYLLPTPMVAGIDTLPEAVFLLALCLTAVAWNLGTWYFGIPNSTTHTYVGAILGATLAYAYLHNIPVQSIVNWNEGEKVLLTLFLSPVLGFFLALAIYYLLRILVKDREMYKPGGGETPPPVYIRGTLIAGAAGVSLLHGSNDGQKSIGLMVLALIGMAPAVFGIDRVMGPQEHAHLSSAMYSMIQVADQHANDPKIKTLVATIHDDASSVLKFLSDNDSIADLPPEKGKEIRLDLLNVHRAINRLLKAESHGPSSLKAEEVASLTEARNELDHHIEQVPLWVIIVSASALGIGTAIGYKRIVHTLGEKIGGTAMNAGQGTAAQLTAVACIGVADLTGAPVSTTHVLSAGVAGTMVASKSGLQPATIRNILITWATTLPGTMAVSFMLCSLFYLAVA